MNRPLAIALVLFGVSMMLSGMPRLMAGDASALDRKDAKPWKEALREKLELERVAVDFEEKPLGEVAEFFRIKSPSIKFLEILLSV